MLDILHDHIHAREEVLIFVGYLFQIFSAEIGDTVVYPASVIGNGFTRDFYVASVGHTVDHSVGVLDTAYAVALVIKYFENLIDRHIFFAEKRENEHFRKSFFEVLGHFSAVVLI